MVDNEGMSKRTDELYQPSVLQYILCYIIWIVLAIGTVFLVLQVRANLMTPLVMLPIDPRTVIVINDVTTIIFGFFALISIIVMEHLLRTGLAKRNFWPRVARVLIILALVLGLSYVVQIATTALIVSKS
jgi:hypothetical protein